MLYSTNPEGIERLGLWKIAKAKPQLDLLKKTIGMKKLISTELVARGHCPIAVHRIDCRRVYFRLPSTTCAALAKTYSSAVYDFGFSALFASALFYFACSCRCCGQRLLVSATAKNAHSCHQYRRDDCRSGRLCMGDIRRHRKPK
jgi:hypothetical protein